MEQNKWLTYKYELLEYSTINTYNLIRGVVRFNKYVVNKISEKDTVSLLLRVGLEDGRILSITNLQILKKGDVSDLKLILLEFWYIRDEAYRDFIIKDLIFFYRINSDEILEPKLSFPLKLVNEKEDYIKILGYSFPTNLDLDSWGIVRYDKINYITTVYRPNSKHKNRFIIKFEGHTRNISYYIKGKLIIEFKDIIQNESLNTYRREIKNYTYHFKYGKLILKEYLSKKRKFTPIKKVAIMNELKIISMDLETRVVDGVMQVYALSIYDGNKFKFFYLSDFKDSNELLVKALLYLKSNKKYNKHNVYLHNFSNFDGIFLLRVIKEVFEKVKLIKRDNDIIEVRATWGKHYSVKFRDSLLLLPV